MQNSIQQFVRGNLVHKSQAITRFLSILTHSFRRRKTADDVVVFVGIRAKILAPWQTFVIELQLRFKINCVNAGVWHWIFARQRMV